MFSMRMENSTTEEAAEFLEELNAPLDKRIRNAERNIGKWLRR